MLDAWDLIFGDKLNFSVTMSALRGFWVVWPDPICPNPVRTADFNQEILFFVKIAAKNPKVLSYEYVVWYTDIQRALSVEIVAECFPKYFGILSHSPGKVPSTFLGFSFDN